MALGTPDSASRGLELHAASPLLLLESGSVADARARGDVELCTAPSGEEAQCESEDSPSSEAASDRRRRRSEAFSAAYIGIYYLAYCGVCLVLTGALLSVTVWECTAPRREVRLWRRRLRPWEEAAEAFVGAALCMETLAVFSVLGRRVFVQDCWRILDVIVACLTLVCGIFFLFRRAVHHVDDVVEDIDVPMLGLRFALQPVRMLSTASMVVRAHRMHRAARQPELKAGPSVDPRRAHGELQSALTPTLAAKIRELLPAHLQFAEWELAYSPRVHGISLSTFYRQQAGPNIVVIKDAQGCLFGGFAPEPWRPQAGAYGHTGASFVFASVGADSQDAFESSIETYWAIPERGRLIQWSDSKMLGLGHAIMVCDDFLRGSTSNCESFASPPLSPSGTDFIIRDFECWQIGCSDGPS